MLTNPTLALLLQSLITTSMRSTTMTTPRITSTMGKVTTMTTWVAEGVVMEAAAVSVLLSQYLSLLTCRFGLGLDYD